MCIVHKRPEGCGSEENYQASLLVRCRRREKTVASTQGMGLGSCPVNMLTILLVGSFLYLHIAQGPITNLQRPLQETHGVGMSVLSQLKWMPWVYPKH